MVELIAGLDPERILRKALNMGAEEAEVYIVESTTTAARSSGGRISRATYDSGITVGVRVVVGGRKGNAGGDVAREADVERLVSDALKIAKVSEKDEEWPGFPSSLGRSGDPEIYDSMIVDSEPEDLLKLVAMIDSRLSVIRGVKPVMTGAMMGINRVIIANTNGGVVERKETRFSAYMEAKSGGGGSYVDYFVSAKMDLDSAISTADRVARRARESDNARHLETGIYDIILEPKVVADILSAALIPAFSADNIQRNRSPLKGKLGEKALLQGLSILDDPHRPWATGSTPFDDEGVRTTRKYLVENGVIKSFLYDTYTAAKEGRESTGNGFRGRPWSDPRPSASNVVVMVDSISEDDAVGEMKNGLIIGSTIGEWLSNPISGMVNATVTFAYRIERGEITGVVKGMVLSGNIYELLSSRLVGGVGKEACMGSFCSPSLYIKSASLAGK